MPHKVLQRTYSPRFNDFALEFYSFVADNYVPFYSRPEQEVEDAEARRESRARAAAASRRVRSSRSSSSSCRIASGDGEQPARLGGHGATLPTLGGSCEVGRRRACRAFGAGAGARARGRVRMCRSGRPRRSPSAARRGPSRRRRAAPGAASTYDVSSAVGGRPVGRWVGPGHRAGRARRAGPGSRPAAGPPRRASPRAACPSRHVRGRGAAVSPV